VVVECSMGNMPDMYNNLVVNTNSPLATTILNTKTNQPRTLSKTSAWLS
jgi:hypothetical protein